MCLGEIKKKTIVLGGEQRGRGGGSARASLLPAQRDVDEKLERKQHVADVELGQNGIPGPTEGEATAGKYVGTGCKQKGALHVRWQNGPEAEEVQGTG